MAVTYAVLSRTDHHVMFSTIREREAWEYARKNKGWVVDNHGVMQKPR